MKGFILISLALFATFCYTSAQDNPFPQLLEQVHEVYDAFEDMKHLSRESTSEHVSNLVQLIVDVLFAEIGTWDARIQQKCPHIRNTEAQGEVLRECAFDKAIEIFGYQSEILNILDAMNTDSNEVSISIQRELADLDIVRNHQNLQSHFAPILAEYRTLLDEYSARVGQEIGNLAVLTGSLPQETSTCINAAFQKMVEKC